MPDVSVHAISAAVSLNVTTSRLDAVQKWSRQTSTDVPSFTMQGQVDGVWGSPLASHPEQTAALREDHRGIARPLCLRVVMGRSVPLNIKDPCLVSPGVYSSAWISSSVLTSYELTSAEMCRYALRNLTPSDRATCITAIRKTHTRPPTSQMLLATRIGFTTSIVVPNKTGCWKRYYRIAWNRHS